MITAVDLLATDFPEPRFAVPGILAEGLNLFVGAPKLGKSWAALNIAVAVASGGRALGQIPVEQGEVLFLALEDGPRRLKARLQAVLDDQPAPEGLYFETNWLALADRGMDDLAGWLTGHPDCRLVWIDTFARLRSPAKDSADRYLVDYMAAEQIKKVADEHRVSIGLVHHSRKAQADDFLDSVSGTHGIAGAADSVIVLRRSRGKADAELLITGRDIEERDLALRFDAHIGTWTLLGDAEEWAMSETRRKILEVVRGATTLTPKQAAEMAGVGHDLARQTMRRMADDGQLKAEGGRYTLSTPVTPVTLSLDTPAESDKVTRVTPPDRGEP